MPIPDMRSAATPAIQIGKEIRPPTVSSARLMRENGSAATCAANSAMRAIDCDQIATPELAASGECTRASEGRPIESWGELLNKEWKGKVGLLNVPSIGTMDCALAVEALGLKKFGDKGNMTKPEIDFLIDYIIPLKKAGHFRAFWENFGESVNLMVNGEVALESMWSPAVAAIQAEGVPCAYALGGCAVGTAALHLGQGQGQAARPTL